jgi:hypothetical protein
LDSNRNFSADTIDQLVGIPLPEVSGYQITTKHWMGMGSMESSMLGLMALLLGLLFNGHFKI